MFAIDSEGEFHQGRGKWIRLWPSEPGVHSLSKLVTEYDGMYNCMHDRDLMLTIQHCCEGSQLFIRGELASDWQFQEYMLDDEVTVLYSLHVTAIMHTLTCSIVWQ